MDELALDINEAKKEVLKLKPNSFNEFFNPLYLQYFLIYLYLQF